jgi:hypothetical protein
MDRKVGLSKNLVSKEKCEMSQAVPHKSLVSEAKKYTHNSPNYCGIRRATSHCYTTVGEYFRKDSDAADVVEGSFYTKCDQSS